MSSFFVHQYPQFLLWTAVLNSFISQSVQVLMVALNMFNVLGLVELHQVYMSPFLKSLRVPSLWTDPFHQLNQVKCSA